MFGHTHVPYHRGVDGVDFINTGSVGRPKDGDPRAGYCVLTLDGDSVNSEQVRLPYDVEAACSRLNRQRVCPNTSPTTCGRAAASRRRSSEHRLCFNSPGLQHHPIFLSFTKRRNVTREEIKMKRIILLALSLTFLCSGLHAQGISGVGSTFAGPLYQRWAQEYQAKTGVQINYQPLGSGAGITYITARYTDFGASDDPMYDSEIRAAPGIVHIPIVAGTVVIAYNIPGVGPGIRLTGDVVSDIFLGKITNWSDPRITGLNPGTRFPNLSIAPLHRSDSSGTTSIFTHYLAEVAPDWKQEVGAGRALHWPCGVSLRGNRGVATGIQQQLGGIGYIELAFAIQDTIFYAAIRNAKGEFIYPNIQSAQAAIAASPLPPDFRKVVVNTPAKDGYPLTGFTYILVFRDDTKPALKQFLLWALTDGQKEAAGLQYVPLPANIQKRALAAVASLK